MAQVGTLKIKDNGDYSFSIKTLTQKISGDLVAVEEKKGNGPSFRAFLNDRTEVGAAWLKTGDKGEYISLQLDDPFLPATLYANSHQREDGTIVLLWNRQSR